MKNMIAATVTVIAVMFTANARPITETELLARTLYAEAGNQSIRGKLAVASVIYNRKKTSSEGTWAGVVLKPYQFSCWNDPHKKNMLPPTPNGLVCLEIAKSMVKGSFEPIGPWTHYYNPSLCDPSWGQTMTDVKVIEDHRFGVTR